MPTYRGTWTARVDQEFEIEANDEAEAKEILDREMSPGRVVELLDISLETWEEVSDDEG